MRGRIAERGPHRLHSIALISALALIALALIALALMAPMAPMAPLAPLAPIAPGGEFGGDAALADGPLDRSHAPGCGPAGRCADCTPTALQPHSNCTPTHHCR
eukprot:3557552-Prymnesium_polylepis.2